MEIDPYFIHQVGHDLITDWKIYDGIYKFVVQWNGSMVDPLITTGWPEFMHYLALPYKYHMVDLQYYDDGLFLFIAIEEKKLQQSDFP